jgi:hypothetical protein
MEAGLPANTAGATHQSRLIEFMSHCSSLVLLAPYHPRRWRMLDSIVKHHSASWDQTAAPLHGKGLAHRRGWA